MELIREISPRPALKCSASLGRKIPKLGQKETSEFGGGNKVHIVFLTLLVYKRYTTVINVEYTKVKDFFKIKNDKTIQILKLVYC